MVSLKGIPGCSCEPLKYYLKQDKCINCPEDKYCGYVVMKEWLLTCFKMSRLMGKQNVRQKTLNCFADLVKAGLKVKYTEVL